MRKDIYESIKRATVAIVVAHPKTLPHKPFAIIGSGFCVHPEGIVVTCEHVFRDFVSQQGYERAKRAIADADESPFEAESVQPYAVFHSHVAGTQVHLIPVPAVAVVTNFDLALLKLHPHAALAHQFPNLPIAAYEEIH